jgi:hypothetical protein
MFFQSKFVFGDVEFVRDLLTRCIEWQRQDIVAAELCRRIAYNADAFHYCQRVGEIREQLLQ